MTRDELIDAALKDPGAGDLSRAVLARAFAAFERQIGATLGNGETVRIAGFGEFTSEVTGPRPGRNPRTGETIEIGETRRIKFRPFSGLKNLVELAEAARKAA